jgi:SAM-dependent methyltransferase
MIVVPRTVKNFYEKKYKKGEEVPRPYKTKILDWLPNEPCQILDVGCGTGQTSSHIRERGHDVIGMDLSLNALKKQREPSRTGTVADANRDLPYEDGQFEGIWCSDIIEHVWDPPRLLEELGRVLVDGGFLILIVPNSAHLFYRLLYLTGRVPADVQVPGHVRFLTLTRVEKIIESSPFRICARRGRNLYVALKESWIPERLRSCFVPGLKTLGFHGEFSYSDDDNLWLLTQMVQYPDPLFSDHFLFKLTKP